MSQNRITTREFYEELKGLNEKHSADMSLLRESLQTISSRVENLVNWAFGSGGARGMDQRIRGLEDLHMEERGSREGRSRFWRIVQQLIAFAIGVVGAVIGALI